MIVECLSMIASDAEHKNTSSVPAKKLFHLNYASSLNVEYHNSRSAIAK